MERKEILEKVKKTEADIREKIEQAQHKRNETLALAQKQARKLEEDNERRIKADQEKLFASMKKEVDEERAKILKKAVGDAEALKKRAQVKKAQEFFVEKFKEFVHV